MREVLRRVETGELKRVMFFTPPRHGKTQQNTIRYSVYRLLNDPTLRIIIAAYNQNLANKFSRDARTIAARYMDIDQTKEVRDWSCSSGGGIRAVGVLGGIAGTGGNLVILDDPVKSKHEVESQQYRDRTYNWFINDIYTRLEPDGAIILTMTRWHEDDLAGRIISDMAAGGEQWYIVRLPAIAESQDARDAWFKRNGLPEGAPDPLGRLPGEALCPDRYPVADLLRIKEVQGADFEPLYQQDTHSRTEGSFTRKCFQSCNIDDIPTRAKFIRYWDLASSQGSGDYTVGVLMARFGETYFVIDVVRGRWAHAMRDHTILKTAYQDKETWGDVEIGFEQELGSSGKIVASLMKEMLKDFRTWACPSNRVGNKEIKSVPYCTACQNGRVVLVKAWWNQIFIDEHCSFPNAKYDDMVDAAATAFLRLRRHRVLEF